MDSAQDNPDDKKSNAPEFQQALMDIVVAFVDVGFGTSPTGLSLMAANDNRPIKAFVKSVVEDEA